MIPRRFLFIVLAFTGSQSILYAQKTPPKDEPIYNQPDIYVLNNGIIHLNATKTIEGGTLIIEKDKIIEVGKNISYPKNAIVIDIKGKHVYPSFIDAFSAYGMPEAKGNNQNSSVQYETSKKGALYWNESIHPELDAVYSFRHDAAQSKEWRKMGFGTVCSHLPDGLMRGTGFPVVLSDEKELVSLLGQKTIQYFSFSKGSSQQAYPSSLMGAIALMRQALYDAQWYINGGNKQECNLALQAINDNKSLPIVFDAGDKFNILRAHKIADEFNLKFIYKAGGNEYQRINEIKGINSPLIVPVNFPAAFDVEDFYDAKNVSLAELKYWEQAPGNPFALYKNGLVFCLTSDGLKDKSQFLPNIRKAIAYGLPATEALKALTETPANLFGISNLVGTLEKNKLANFIITTEELFTEKCVINENWVKGKRFEIKQMFPLDIRGEYSLNVNQKIMTLVVKGDINTPVAEVKVDTSKVNATVKRDLNTVSISFIGNKKLLDGIVRLSGTINYDSGSWDGNGQLPDGSVVMWTAIRKEKFKEESRKKVMPDSVQIAPVTFPNMAYGFDSIPVSQVIWIRHATVWTNEADGVLKDADVILKDGKILQVGKNLSKPTGKHIEIDATGKHLTAGIIDEHSHIAISNGVNESGQTNSGEVSIGDVVNSDDINIYRQLAGGVTACQLLHGSANPVGGQSALIKLRWGKSPDEMKIEGAPGFIKFALGENVKQSNWGSEFNSRYPQTRMGVEQVFYNTFQQALVYEREWKNYTDALTKSKIKPVAPRKDLEMETMLEIVRGKRFITCHSYVQSEINMLMHVADSFGFKVNTFTHILEGYKVADKMAKHGVSASSFSDWWAYKFEVYDAIPYNAAIMTKMGVNVGINSDDAEMARRLNQEAAKSVKYGGLTEEEALKLVTLNPAKMLHLDDRMGSIKSGKDADVVLWSDHPLSIYAKPEKTIVDGIVYYDVQQDEHLRKSNEAERLRITRKMVEAKANGEAVMKPVRKKNKSYHCETIGEEGEEAHN